MAELRYVDWDGLVYYDGKIKEYIDDRDENYLKMGGIVTFNNLPDPSWQNLNYIYKVTTGFTSNNRFDKPGYIYPAGTWVQCVDVNNDASQYLYIIFNEESIGGTADIDLSDYYTKGEVDKLIPDVDEFATKSALTEVQQNLSATEEAVQSINIELSNIQNNYVTNESLELKDYVTEQYVTQNYTTTTELAKTYVNQTDLEEQNYITHQEATTQIEQIVRETIKEEIVPDSMNYDTF